MNPSSLDPSPDLVVESSRPSVEKHRSKTGSRRLPPGGDYVGWARRLNSRWLVHHGLDEVTQAYLDHLSATDPVRLGAACRIAWRLVGHGGQTEDPKPRFYGGIFSLSTEEEARRFLFNHPFTALMRPDFDARAFSSLPSAARLGPSSLEKAGRLRAEIQRLLRRLGASGEE